MEKVSLPELNFCLWGIWGFYLIVTLKSVKPTKQAENWPLRLQHILPTIIGFALIFSVFRGPWIFGRLFGGKIIATSGLCLTGLGIAFAIWARIHLGKYWSGIITLKEDHRLIRTGPYLWVRHPIYSGFLLATFGSALTAGTGDAMIGLGIMVIAYLVKLAREERLLTETFGEEYLQFKKESSALIPFLF